MTPYQVAVFAHVAFGSLALAVFWTTAALRKGTRRHRRIGSTYLLAMLGVMVTACPLAIAAFAAGHSTRGVFLLYLIVITGTPLWLARRAIRQKNSVAEFLRAPYRPVAWANIVCGIVVLGVGIKAGAPLLDGLSAIGIVVGVRMLQFARAAPASPQWWLKQHYGNIVGSGIAMHVAFLNVGLPNLLPVGYAGAALYVAWFGPVGVAVLAIGWLNRRYGRGNVSLRC